MTKENTEKQATELEKKIKLTQEKIEEKKKEIEDINRLNKLKKEYNDLTYRERHPILSRLTFGFNKLKKETAELQKKAGEYSQKNPWDY